MSNINKIILSGYLGVNPELKVSPSGTRITRFTIGCKSQWGDNAPMDWFKVVCFNGTAEFVQRYGKKKDYAVIAGALHKNEWKDKDGSVHKDYEIWANEVELRNNNTTQQQTTDANNPFLNAGMAAQEVPNTFDDDIPF